MSALARITCHQLPDALVHRGDEFLVGDGVLQRGDGVRLIIPVVEAVIETDFQAVLAGGGDRFRHQIAPVHATGVRS